MMMVMVDLFHQWSRVEGIKTQLRQFKHTSRLIIETPLNKGHFWAMQFCPVLFLEISLTKEGCPFLRGCSTVFVC